MVRFHGLNRCSHGQPPAEEYGGAHVDGPVHPRPELGEAALVGHAEHDPEDDLEGERVHPLEGAEVAVRASSEATSRWATSVTSDS